MLKLLDVVKLNDSDADVPVGSVGTIVEVLSDNCFIVEFFDKDHETIDASLDKVYNASQLIKT